MIKKAIHDDIPRLFEIRHAVKENKLASPDAVTVADCEWFIDNSTFWLWMENGDIQGFSAADPRDGSIFALFVHPAYEGRGIGQRLLPLACQTLKAAGYQTATLTTGPSTRAVAPRRWCHKGRRRSPARLAPVKLAGPIRLLRGRPVERGRADHPSWRRGQRQRDQQRHLPSMPPAQALRARNPGASDTSQGGR